MDNVIKVTIDDVEREMPAGLTVSEAFFLLGLEVPGFFYFHKDEKKVSVLSFVEVDGQIADPYETIIQGPVNIKKVSERTIVETKEALGALLGTFHKGFICPKAKTEELMMLLKNGGLDPDGFLVSEKYGFTLIYIPREDVTGYDGSSVYDFIYYGIRPEEYESQRKWEKISEILQDTAVDTHLLIDHAAYGQLSAILGLPQSKAGRSVLESEIRKLGFKGLGDIKRGQKIMVIEEADELLKRLSRRMDDQNTILPMISVSSYGMFRYLQNSSGKYSPYLSTIKSAFDLESILIKSEHKCITIGIYGDFADEMMPEKDKTDTDFMMTPKEFARLALGNFDIQCYPDQTEVNCLPEDSLNLPSYSVLGTFLELVNGRGSNDLAFIRIGENLWKAQWEIRGHRFTAAIGYGMDALTEMEVMLKQDSSSFDLIEISGDPSWKENLGWSLFKDPEVNDLYKKFLISPGSGCVRKE